MRRGGGRGRQGHHVRGTVQTHAVDSERGGRGRGGGWLGAAMLVGLEKYVRKEEGEAGEPDAASGRKAGDKITTAH